MREVALRPRQEEVFVEFDSALWFGVDLDHPSLDPIGIELPIDSTVERVGDVNATSIATNLTIWGGGSRLFGCGARETMPPMRSFPVSFGLNGLETSY